MGLIIIAFVGSLLGGLLFYPGVIYVLRQTMKKRIQKQIRPLMFELHNYKEGTPNMGGIVIVSLAAFFVFLLSGDFATEEIILISGIAVLGLLGGLDDVLVSYGKSFYGLSVKSKFLLQIFCSFGLAFWLYYSLGFQEVFLWNGYKINLGWGYIVWATLVIVATMNATNITDGLDGLAPGILLMLFIFYTLFAYQQAQTQVALLSSAIAGGLAAFMWFNVSPAYIFMGDLGALAIGGTLALISLITKTSLWLPLLACIFFGETITVILQSVSKKLWNRKIFHIAPIHHHFEARGNSEQKITILFWFINMIVLFLIGGLILKL